MATTENAVLDRVRDVLLELGYAEAKGTDFSKTPVAMIDQAFVVRYQRQTPIGHSAFGEEARGTVEIDVGRSIGDDLPTARRLAWQDVRVILPAIVRDGSQTSGEYAVEDAGQSAEVVTPAGASYLYARMRVPINFEATL